MTATVTQNENTNASTDEPVVDDLDMGGSPEAIQADDESSEAQTDEQSSKDEDEGEEPEPQTPPGVDPEEVADLKAELSQYREIIGALNERMERDPAFRKVLEGGSDTESEPDLVEDFKRTLSETLEPDAANALQKALLPIFDHVRKLEGDLRDVKPRVHQLSQSLGSRQFQSSLASEGVAPAEQQSRDFQRHLKRLRKSSDFQSAEARNPKFAAQHAAATYLASKAKTSGWRDDKARLATAKTGKGGDSKTARSSTLAEKVHEVVRHPGVDYIAQAHALRKKHPGAVIRYVDPK